MTLRYRCSSPPTLERGSTPRLTSVSWRVRCFEAEPSGWPGSTVLISSPPHSEYSNTLCSQFDSRCCSCSSPWRPGAQRADLDVGCQPSCPRAPPPTPPTQFMEAPASRCQPEPSKQSGGPVCSPARPQIIFL